MVTKYKFRFGLILTTVVMMAVLGACATPEVTDVKTDFKQSSALLQANIQTFGMSSGTKIERLIQSVEEAESEEDVVQVRQAWEIDLDEIKLQYKSVLESFDDSGKRAKRYFDLLNKKTNSLNSQTTREEQQRANTMLEDNWSNQYAQTRDVVLQLGELLPIGDDVTLLLEIAIITESIEMEIRNLEKIKRTAQELLDRAAKLQAISDQA